MPDIQINAVSVRALALAPTKWPWLGRIFAAWVIVMVLLFLGILTFTAIGEMVNECRREPIYRTASDGSVRVTSRGDARVVNGKQLGCRTALGNFGMIIPSWLSL
jgi:hypothetical protein